MTGSSPFAVVRRPSSSGIGLSERSRRSWWRCARHGAAGRQLAIGVSDHAVPRREDLDAADYATLAPWGEVPGKGPAVGSDGFRECLKRRAEEGLVTPTWALGGLGSSDLRDVRGVGATAPSSFVGWTGAAIDAAVEQLTAAWEACG